jgi:NAD(P)H dehydrogenase (quinone)
MPKVLVCYYSRTGHTRQMAEIVAESAGQVEPCQVDCRSVEDVSVRQLLDYDAICLGSPVYYGTMAAEIKRLLDDSVQIHGQLAGKVGGAFASSANLGGGNESTVLGLLQALLVHGMVVPGSASGDHYGPVAVNAPDDRAAEGCRRLGKTVAELAIRLSG